MALLPVTPPAGIVKNGTDYANKGRWVDGNLVRFENGFLKPIGGWNKLRNTALDGEPIGMYAYKDNAWCVCFSSWYQTKGLCLIRQYLD